MKKITINEALAKGLVKFTYEKNDGTIRESLGTRNPSLIGEYKATPSGCENKVARAGYTSYFDLGKNSWRCFAESKVKTFEAM